MSYNNSPHVSSGSDRPWTLQSIIEEIKSPDLALGIDMLEVHCPIIRLISDPDEWTQANRDLHRNKVWGHVDWPLGNGSTLLKIRNDKNSVGSGQYALIQFNPSTILFGDGRLATLAETEGVWDEVLACASNYVQVPRDPARYSVCRVDVARDFAPVSDMCRVLGAARAARCFKGIKPFTYANNRTQQLESVTYQTKRTGCVRFYDKSAQMGAGKDWLRIEQTIKGRDRKNHDLKTLKDLSQERLCNAFRSRLRHFCAPTGPLPADRLEEILRDPPMQRALLNQLGRECLEDRGLEVPMTDYDSRWMSKLRNTLPYHRAHDLIA